MNINNIHYTTQKAFFSFSKAHFTTIWLTKLFFEVRIFRTVPGSSKLWICSTIQSDQLETLLTKIGKSSIPRVWTKPKPSSNHFFLSWLPKTLLKGNQNILSASIIYYQQACVQCFCHKNFVKLHMWGNIWSRNSPKAASKLVIYF